VKYALAAAGTGGHVFPALAVGDALVERGIARDDIIFFGGNRMEKETVPAAGYRFVELEIQGLKRSLSPQNLKLISMVRNAKATVRDICKHENVGALATFGGYVSGPVAMAARAAGVPLFVHEQNAMPGVANRLIARWATEVFVAFDRAQDALGGRVIGNPLRSELTTFDRADLRSEARRRYGLDENITVLGILGGSLGARALNDVATQVSMTLDRDKFAILHLAGRDHATAVRERADRSGTQWVVLDFEDQMRYFYAASDVVLSRSGALTISELAVTKTPAVVVPLAIGTADHQAANAAGPVRDGAIVMVREDSIDQVPAALEQLLSDVGKRSAMAEAYGPHARKDAAGVIAAAMIGAAT
jgi:UDP-N-acetylglucosamine--N-acetylmuramyl-(pentapeptide) pyrophosphoryl-undecaprenol N-acetylglucosamine transferase